MKNLILLLSLMASNPQASTIFVPDSDTALLVELVSTTISQLNELEQLVSNSEKYTKKMQEYNELAIDHWYRAQRVHYLAQEFISLKDLSVNDLASLNYLIRELKYNIKELEETLREYHVMEKESERIAKNALKDDFQIKRDMQLANLNVQRAHQVKTPGNAAKVNMQVNAEANKNLVDLKNKSNQMIKLLAEQNKSLSKEMKIKTKKRIHKAKFYLDQR